LPVSGGNTRLTGAVFYFGEIYEGATIMLDLVQETGKAFISNGIQLILGTLLSIPSFFIKIKPQSQSAVKTVLLILISVLFGMIFPLGPYGLIPLAAALFSGGVQAFIILPFVLSNSIFNLLFAFNDPWFVWGTGIRRVIFAFGTAMVAGLLIYFTRLNDESLVSNRLNQSSIAYREDFPGAMKSLMRNLATVGIFMTAGVIADTFFNKYAIWKIFEIFYMNPQTAQIPQFFSSYDVDKPFFTLLTVIFKLFTNLTAMSAMVYLLKRKGFMLFIGYYGSLASVFALLFFL
jgi:hypothetical protein